MQFLVLLLLVVTELDISGLSDGTYSGSFSLSDTTADPLGDISDVSATLDIAVNINLSPTSNQKVAADVNNDGVIDISDVSAILDMAVNISDTGGGVIRNASISDPSIQKRFLSPQEQI